MIHTFWTGPCIVKQMAEKFREAGFEVDCEGTEKVYIRSELNNNEILERLKAKHGTSFGLK